MGSIVKEITIIEKDGNGNRTSETFYKKKDARRESGWAKPIIKAQRRSLKASQVFVNELLARNEQSGKKKKDGWLRDAGENSFKLILSKFRYSAFPTHTENQRYPVVTCWDPSRSV